MSMMTRAREAARKTPVDRNRSADFFRTAAICFVVLGHWMLAAPYVPAGQLDMRWIVAEQPWTQYLTWIFQVMAVFFFVGGYANAASWTSARMAPEKRRLWASSRMRRLLLPVVPLIALWSLAAVVAHQLGAPLEDLVRAMSRDALIPVWFLAVYIMVTLLVPLSYAAWERFGLRSVAVLLLLAILVDVTGVGLGQTWVRWANYGPIWMALHQFGYWWRRGDVPAARASALVVLGVVWMAVLIVFAHYPVSMVSVAGEDFSNSLPPTTALLALGTAQIGLLILVAPLVQKWLLRETPWAVVILVSQNIMTIFLWHLTVVSLLIGASLALGGLGLHVAPGSAAWWWLRPIWFAIYAAALLPFLAIFGRFESGARAQGVRPVGGLQTAVGTVVTCAGLSDLALTGIGSAGFQGLNWFAVLLILGGIGLAAGIQPTYRPAKA